MTPCTRDVHVPDCVVPWLGFSSFIVDNGLTLVWRALLLSWVQSCEEFIIRILLASSPRGGYGWFSGGYPVVLWWRSGGGTLFSNYMSGITTDDDVAGSMRQMAQLCWRHVVVHVVLGANATGHKDVRNPGIVVYHSICKSF